MSTPATSPVIVPAGNGTLALVLPAHLADATVGGFPLRNLTSGWERPACGHGGSRSAESLSLLVHLGEHNGERVHVVESAHKIYGDAIDAKYATKRDGKYRLVRQVFACGHAL